MKIIEFVKPDMDATRSINLERDLGAIGVLKNYQITDKTKEILGRFSDALWGEKISAWSLTGPYGMGKSSFINYLLALTSSPDTNLYSNAWQKLEEYDEVYFEKLRKGIEVVDGQGFLQIPITASYEPVNSTVLRGIKNALKIVTIPQKRKLQAQINAMEQADIVDSQTLLEIIAQIISLANKPIIIVIDEFGKNLDFMSHHPHKGDIFILQQLSELDSVYIWVCLHQAFDEYAAGLSIAQQQEWRKIQGRFEDISFVESTGQMIKMITYSMKHSEEEPFKGALSKWAQEAFESIKDTNLVHNAFFTPEMIKKIYPLHPITAISLIELCQRYAQNDRTLLSFLCSGDWNALPAFLKREEFDGSELPTVGLDYLYDYFFNINANKPVYQAESQRWLEIYDIINEAGDISESESSLLKTIGVLNLLSGAIGVTADYDSIYTIMQFTKGYEPVQVKKWLDKLIKTKGLIYREFANELRLWEGSDFDIYGAIRNQKSKMAIDSLDQIIQEYLPLSPVIASRHALKTGTVRRFERRWLGVESINDELMPEEGYDGLLVYCFGTVKKPDNIPAKCADERPLLIAYVSSQTTLIELALEAAASRYVYDTSPELEHDRVARKEVSYRVNMSELQFRSYLSQLYSPSSGDIDWYSEGQKIKIKSSKKMSEEISRLCDSYYSSSPHIGNEMINYDKLSSAAARARRELVEAMATREEIELLGFIGYGPEVAIYRTLLKAQGLHIEEPGGWHLVLNDEDCRLAALWKQIEGCIIANGDKGLSAAEILRILQKPPFGMRQGPASIYLSLYLLVEADDIAIFREDNYIPYLSEAAIALFLKRPDLFVLKRFISTGVEQKVFNIYRKLISVAGSGGDLKLRNATMLGVIGPLIKFIEALPSYSRNTRAVSLAAQRVRSTIMNSTEPMQLLFVDLPQAAGVNIDGIKDSSDWQEELQTQLWSALKELGDAYSNLNQKVQQTLLDVFRHIDINELREELTHKTAPLIEVCSDSELKPVLQSIIRPTADTSEWIRGIAGIIAKKPLDAWQDNDFIPFAANLRDFADRIEQLQTLNTLGANLNKNAVLLSIMGADGKVKREVISPPSEYPKITDLTVKEILALPQKESKRILASLNNLVGGISNDSNQ